MMETDFRISDRFVVRLGYRGFLSAVWMLWKMNRNARTLGITSRAEIVLPLRWFR